MRKIIFTTIIIIISSTFIFSQTNNSGDTISQYDFDYAIQNQFTKTITGKTNSSIGSYVEVEAKNPEASISYNINLGMFSLLLVKASGGVSDGFFTLFKNSRFNSNVSVDFQFNVLFNPFNKKSITFNDEDYTQYTNNLNNIEFSKRQYNAFLNYKYKYIYKKNTDAIKMHLDSLKILIDTLTYINEFSHLSLYERDSINFLIENLSLNRDSLSNVLTNYPDTSAMRYNLNKDLDKRTDDNKLNLKLEGFRFGLFSIGYKINRKEFKHLDTSLIYNEQLSTKNFISHELRFQYSFYNFSPIPNVTYFYCFGTNLNYDDNFSNLHEIEITEEDMLGPNPGDRKSVKKYNAYMNEYKMDIKSMRLFIDYYKYFFPGNNFAIHLNSDYHVIEKERPLFNATLGILFCLKNSDDKSKSLINTELYYNFYDIFNNTSSSYRLFERNEVGIRFTFPYLFLN